MKKSRLIVCILLSASLLFVPALSAHAVVFVTTTGNDLTGDGLTWATAKRTIQAGVTLAVGQPDKTLWVARSTVPVPQYLENVSVPIGVLVYGRFAGTENPLTFDLTTRNFVANETVVQPTAPAIPANPAFTLLGGNRIDGFTIQSGAAVQGAAVFYTAGSTAIVAYCVIKNNASVRGAGIFAQNGILSALSCTFTDNTAQDIALTPGPAGGGIYADNCALSVSQCAFAGQLANVSLNNATAAKGGGIYASAGTICAIEGSRFNACLATGDTVATYTVWGGAAYVSGVSALIRNNFIYLCGARGAGSTQPAYGGGIAFVNQGTLNLFNNTFYLDQVTPQAGLVTDTDRPYGNGSAVFLLGSGNTANVINNIITKCRGTAVVNQGMIVNFNYNVLWHNAGGDIYGFNFPVYTTNPLTNKDFNIMKDPNLRGPSTGDLHILYGSPARDAGRNSGAPSTDIDGEVRPNWSGVVGPAPVPAIVDIGADEFVDSGAIHKGGADNDPLGAATTDLPDLDLIFNPFDNCPATANVDQTDSNGDKMGDACTTLAAGTTTLAYYVDGILGSDSNSGASWATAFKTIQRGIDAADSHNQPVWTKNYEVWVQGGPAGQTYTENIMVWHGVAVYGAWAGGEAPPPPPPPTPPSPYVGRDVNTNQTTIDGSDANSTVMMAHLPQDRYLSGATKTTYDGLVTVLDCFRPFNGTGELGGGVSVYKDLVNVSTCRIDSNQAALGGGIYFYKSNGIVGDGLAPPPAALLSGSTRLLSNTATGAVSYAGYGGGAYCERGSPTLFANLIEGNTAFFGGGVGARKSSPQIIENLIGCADLAPVFLPNVAQGDGSGNGRGGGIYLDTSADAGMNMLTVVSNQATGATGQGGGLYVSGSNFTMKNSILAFNTAAHAVPASRGGAIFATGTSPAIADPWCYIQYCDFWTNSATQFVNISDPTTPPPPTSCAQTNYAVDPLFTLPADCNYTLAAGSPLIGAGDPGDGSPNIGAVQQEDPPVTVAEAKQTNNGVIVEISGVVVTAVFAEGFYVEAPDRTAGVFVRTYSSPVQMGSLVDVSGIMSQSGIEREVVNPTITINFGSGPQIRPLAMSNRQVGGGPSGTRVLGVAGGVGPSNLGLLIETWGKVTSVHSGSPAYFMIDDGSNVGVKVIPPAGAQLPSAGAAVVVTGISCVDYSGPGYKRAIRTRRASDLGYPQR